MPSRLRLLRNLAIALGLVLLGGIATASESRAAEGLRPLIERLAERHGFVLEGAEHLGMQPVSRVGESPRLGIAHLLSDYDYVLVRDGSGRIALLSILGLHTARPQQTQERHVTASGRGRGHHIYGVVTGPTGLQLDVPFLIDTGASTIVLAESEVATLGFEMEALQRAAVQTANGVVEGHVGVLAYVQVNGAEAHDVTVTFLPDEQLGERRLLGMSFLSRFVLTIDDSRNLVTLTPRGD